MDALKNFATSLVATAPSPATSGTSLVVTAGQGSYFPATPFDATIWPAGVQPTNSNAEIVRVTAVATDTFTITRAQYGTTAQSIAVGYQIAQTVDANLLNQLAPLSGATFTGEVSVPDIKITGLTGATASSSRLVGTTTSGPPTSGTFAVGDMVIDQTATIWFCTTAGTPGTWINVTVNSLVVRSATATAGPGEFTIFGTSGTSGQTITLPGNAVNGSLYQIKNLSPYTVNILGGTNSISVSGTIYNATTPYTIPLNAAYTFVYTSGIWYCFTTTDINKMGGLPLATSGGGTGLATIGTAGQSLVVNSGATGLQYANTSAGPVVLYSANGTALPNETSIATAGSVTVTLPSAPPNGTVNTVSDTAAGSPTTISRGGTDTITYVVSGGLNSGFTSLTISPGASRRFVYNSGIWTEIGAPTLSGGTGTLPVISGGTGSATASAALSNLGGVPKSTVTAAGDLIVGTASATVSNLPIGSARQVPAVNQAGTALQYQYHDYDWQHPTGTIAATLPRMLAGSNWGLSSGTMYLTPIYLYAGQVVSNINFLTTGTAGASLTHQYAVLLSGSASVAATADKALTSMAATTPFTWPIATIASGASTSYTVPTSGIYYVGIVIVGTTMPTLLGFTSAGNISLSPRLQWTSTVASTPASIGTTYSLASQPATFLYNWLT
jgi:hypothetical protein